MDSNIAEVASVIFLGFVFVFLGLTWIIICLFPLNPGLVDEEENRPLIPRHVTIRHDPSHGLLSSEQKAEAEADETSKAKSLEQASTLKWEKLNRLTRSADGGHEPTPRDLGQIFHTNKKGEFNGSTEDDNKLQIDGSYDSLAAPAGKHHGPGQADHPAVGGYESFGGPQSHDADTAAQQTIETSQSFAESSAGPRGAGQSTQTTHSQNQPKVGSIEISYENQPAEGLATGQKQKNKHKGKGPATQQPAAPQAGEVRRVSAPTGQMTRGNRGGSAGRRHGRRAGRRGIHSESDNPTNDGKAKADGLQNCHAESSGSAGIRTSKTPGEWVE